MFGMFYTNYDQHYNNNVQGTTVIHWRGSDSMFHAVMVSSIMKRLWCAGQNVVNGLPPVVRHILPQLFS